MPNNKKLDTMKSQPTPIQKDPDWLKQGSASEVKKPEEPKRISKIDTSWLEKANSASAVTPSTQPIKANPPAVKVSSLASQPAKKADQSWIKKQDSDEETKETKPPPQVTIKKIDHSWMNKESAEPSQSREKASSILPKQPSTEKKDDFKSQLEAMLARGPRKPAASMAPQQSTGGKAVDWGLGMKTINEEEQSNISEEMTNAFLAMPKRSQFRKQTKKYNMDNFDF